MSDTDDKITIQSITSPGRTERVESRQVHGDARRADRCPARGSTGPLTVAKAKEVLLPSLPNDLFPGGAKAGWWLKAVQLDLEAKGLIQRAQGKPVRLFKSSSPA